MKSNIDIFTQHYCPFHIIVLGVVFLIISLFAIFLIPVLGLIFLLLGIMLTTTHYRLTLVPSNKKYREYLWIFGIKRGFVSEYDDMLYVFINRIEHNSEYGIVARLNAKKIMFHMYLKFSNGETAFLGKSIAEKSILKKANKIAEILRVSVKQNY